jgi:aspartate/methionine/tyrosine aminotransferase
LILEPYFDAYKNISTLLGIKTIGLPLEMSETKAKLYHNDQDPSTFDISFRSSDFQINFDKFHEILKKNPKIKLFIFNTPHNPTGKVFTKDELQKIANILRLFPKITILSDEVYEFMCFDKTKHFRFASLPDMYERTISLFSAGKTFSCTGWRVGYAISCKKIATKILKAHATNVFCSVTPFEIALTKAFQAIQTNDYLENLKKQLESKRNLLVQALFQAKWKPIVPQGGYFVCCNISPLVMMMINKKHTTTTTKKVPKDYQFVEKFCQEKKLAMIPTSSFYSNQENCFSTTMVRLAFCKDEEMLQQAIDIIHQNPAV